MGGPEPYGPLKTTYHIKKMIAHVLVASMLVTLKGQAFELSNNIYTHDEEEAVGVSIAGDMAHLFMVWWDRRFKEHLA